MLYSDKEDKKKRKKEAWIRNERSTRPNTLIPLFLYIFLSTVSQLGHHFYSCLNTCESCQ